MTNDAATTERSFKLIAWLQLVRLPNVFTVLADVGAAFLLVSGGPAPVARFSIVLLAGVALYWAGMILNDIFDVDKDRRERRERPLASGAIPLTVASYVGWALLLLGVVLAAAAGYLPDDERATTWLPAAIAVALAALIVAYDGPLKSTPFAPAAMGGCRVLSFLLGASPVLEMQAGFPVIPRYLLGIALGFGVYVMGITTLARDEAGGGHRANLRTGFVVILIGAIMLAVAPGLSRPAERAGWTMPVGDPFYLLIAMIILPVAIRGWRLQLDPQPAQLGNTIRAGILTIIPLSAAFALLGAGPQWGLTIFVLMVPAIALAIRMRVT